MLLTPPGTGAIAVVRVVGPDAVAIVTSLVVFQTEGTQGSGRSAGQEKSDLPLGRLFVGRFQVDGETIDEVVMSRVACGETFAVDLATHGGVRVVERILGALASRGARLCIDREAFLPTWAGGNRIEEEAAAAMVSARTERAIRFLAWQRRHLPKALERAAAMISANPVAAQEVLAAALERYGVARMLIDGAVVALIGPPNSGKSTLFNALVGRAAAIVSPFPGTTRDWVDAAVDIGGFPVTLVDTAGPRRTESDVEFQAIRRGFGASESADVRVLVLDGSQPVPADGAEPAVSLEPGSRLVVVLNKTDLGCACVSSALPPGWVIQRPPLGISALTGSGLGELTHRLSECLGGSERGDSVPTFFTARQARTAQRILSDWLTRLETTAAMIRGDLIGRTGAG